MCITPMKTVLVCHSLNHSVLRAWEESERERICIYFFDFLQHLYCQVSSSRAHLQNDISAAQGSLRTNSISSV